MNEPLRCIRPFSLGYLYPYLIIIIIFISQSIIENVHTKYLIKTLITNMYIYIYIFSLYV